MSDYRKLYIVGAGGFGREVLWLAERINAYQKAWDIAGFIDDNAKLHGRELNGIQVVGDCTYFQNLQKEVSVILAIGSPELKKRLVGQLSQYDHVEFATLIDPSVIMSEHIEIGEGTIICASSILTPILSSANMLQLIWTVLWGMTILSQIMLLCIPV